MNLIESILGDEFSEPREPRPLHEAQIATLKEIFAVYGPCPFTPGDLVMPRKTSHFHGDVIGEPHIVLEVRDGVEPDFDYDDGNKLGRRLDMRVAVLFDSNYACFWVESFEFEPYRQQEV